MHAGLVLSSGAAGVVENQNEEDEDGEKRKKRVLVTRAAGGVGICLVQLATLATVYVVCC